MTETTQTPFLPSRFDNPLDVQDAYTLRCMLQVHGVARDAILCAR
jgi:histidine ammonia-lyase